MTEEEKRLTLRWIETWRRARPELERIRREEIRNADTQRAMEIFEDAFESARRTHPPRSQSGLVELQRLFARARKCAN